MKKVMILATTAIFSISCAQQSGNRYDESAVALLDKMQSSIDNGVIMYGHQDDLMYGHTWRIDAEDRDFARSDVKDVSGKYPAVYGLDLGGIEMASTNNLDNNSFAAMRASAIKHYERGGVITFSWHPRNPLTGGDAWDVSSKEVVASILEGGKCHDVFMEWLCRMADYLGSFKTSDGQSVPIIFRPWHEHTGSWFWWGQELCSTEQYVALWRMTYDYLCVERGLHNLIWSYSPGAGNMTEEKYLERWPGDEIVDMIGVDCYQYGSSEQYMADVRNSLDVMIKIGDLKGKMMALTETGYEGIPQADWWTETLYKTIKDYPLVYVLTWRNACDKPEHYYAPFEGQISADNFNEFSSLAGVGML